eukprot:gene126-737_t
MKAWINIRYFVVIVISGSLCYILLNYKLRSPQTVTKHPIKVQTFPNDCDLLGHGLQVGGAFSHDEAKRRFKRKNRLNKNTKIILLYTGLFFHAWWWNNKEEDLHRYTHAKKCKVRNCYFTYNKNAFGIADAVVFHGVDINNPICYRVISEKRPKGQKWILFMHESPVYTFDLEPYNGLFNWTMTYMRNSEIYVPYFSFEKLSSRDKRPEKGFNFAAGKTGKVVWVASHCGLLRDSYAMELSRYIEVKVYGDCGKLFKHNMGRCSDWGTECEDEIKHYKFYLSFENCFCEDYITEKYWDKGLRYGLIPIVMGGIDSKSNVIPQSYINVDDYSSIQGLAKYLKHLDSNDTAYNEYFKWRYKYKVTTGIDSFCEICKTLHGPVRDNVYDDLNDYWGKRRNCDKYSWKIKGIRSQIAKSIFQNI